MTTLECIILTQREICYFLNETYISKKMITFVSHLKDTQLCRYMASDNCQYLVTRGGSKEPCGDTPQDSLHKPCIMYLQTSQCDITIAYVCLVRFCMYHTSCVIVLICEDAF